MSVVTDLQGKMAPCNGGTTGPVMGRGAARWQSPESPQEVRPTLANVTGRYIRRSDVCARSHHRSGVHAWVVHNQPSGLWA